MNENLNIEFKIALIRRFGNQREAGKKMELSAAQIAGLIHGRQPNWTEVKKLLDVFTTNEMKKFFGPRKGPPLKKLEGENAVNVA